VAGGIVVAIGIIWEAGWKLNIPTGLVVIGVILESFCTIKLFVTDEGISNSQQSVIRVQNDQIIALHLALLPRLLEQRLTAAALSKFKDTPFVVVSAPDSESKSAAGQIRFMLDLAKWTRSKDRLPQFDFRRQGVFIHLVFNSLESAQRTDEAAKALKDVLLHNKIDAELAYPVHRLDERGAEILPTMLPAVGPPCALVIEVGPKPLPKSLQVGPVIPADLRSNEMWGNVAE
jgi:hypothetical protein